MQQVVIGQVDSVKLVQTLILNAKSVESDLQNNIYVTTSKNELLKLNDTGLILRRYSNNYLGQGQLISISNPLQIVLFYPGFQTIIILDNTLNEIKRISLEQLNIPYVTTLGYSPERELWYFDEQIKRFKKVNINGRHILEANLNESYIPTRIQKIQVRKNELKIWCDSTFLLTLDMNGNFKSQISQQGEWIYWNENTTAFFKDQKLIFRTEGQPKSLGQNPIPSALPSMQSLSIMNNGLIGLDREGKLYLFKNITKP